MIQKGTSSTSFKVSSLNSLSASMRYRGMIHESFSKKVRNSLFRLFDYVSTVSPRLTFLNEFVSVIRILQFFGPSICSQYAIFWKKPNLSLTVDIFSIFYHLFPGFIRETVGTPFMYVYFGIMVIFLIIILGSAFHFSKHAELPRSMILTMTVLFATIGYILHPIGLQFYGELIGLMITYPESYLTPVDITALVISLFVFFIYVFIYINAYSVTLTFRPDSLMTVVPQNQMVTLVCTLAVTFLPAVASKMEFYPSIALTIATALIYILSIFEFFSRGGFVKLRHFKAMTASAICGAILLLIVSFCVLLHVEASEVIIVVIVVIWVLCYLLMSFVFTRRSIKNMRILDEISDNFDSQYDMIRSSRQFADLVVTGFRNAHPVCISFDVFKGAVERWPKSLDVWLLFAKFTAIYPEETQQLSYVELGMIQNKMKGSYAKHTMQQIESIIKQRETNLIPELKSKLDGIGKRIQTSKAKIRYIWDLVLQGNTNELETIIGRANKSILNVETDFNQLLGKFPNNRFVARAYARFLRDVVADHEMNQVWVQKCAMLARGIQISPDIAHDLGIIAFPNLPKTLEGQKGGMTQQQQNANNMTDDTLTQEIEDDENMAQDGELKQSIKNNISNLSIPSYRNAKILHVSAILILFVIPMILVTIFAPIYIDEITGSLTYLYSLTKMRTVLFQTLGVMIHYINENINWSLPDTDTRLPGFVLFPFPTYAEAIKPECLEEESPSEVWGYSFDSRKQLETLTISLSNLITSVSPLKSYKVGNKAMDYARSSIFDDKQWFTYVYDTKYSADWTPDTDRGDVFITKTEEYQISVINLASQYVSLYNDVLSLDNIVWDSYNKHYMGTTLNNMKNTSIALTDTVAQMLTFITNQNMTIQKITQIAMIVIIIAIVILYSIICFYTIHAMKRDKLTIYRCLTSLQKSIVSRVAESFRILRKEEDEENRSTRSRDEELSKQEENLLKLFSTSGDTGNGQTVDTFFTIITTLLLIGLHVVMCVFVIQKFQETSQKYNQTSPHIEHSMASYAFDFCAVMLTLLLPGAAFPNRNFNIYGYSEYTLMEAINSWQNYAASELTLMKYGDSENDAPSLSALGINTVTSDNIPAKCNTSSIYQSFHDIYDCSSPEFAQLFSQFLIQRLVNIFNHTEKHILFGGKDRDLTHIWHLHNYHVFDKQYYPLFKQLISNVELSIEGQVSAINKIGYIIVVVAILIDLIFIYILNESEKRQKYAMTLLLQCPGKSVLQNNHVASVLGGNFNLKLQDMTTRDADFYDELVENMPDSVIIVRPEDGTIASLNKATERVYGISNEEFLGNKIEKLGELYAEKNPFKDLFIGEEKKKKSFDMNVIITKENNQICHIDMQFVSNPEGIFVASRDITQSVMYDKLIADEKLKSDSLLASILPPRLVPRVASGEKNISFAVQSVTIVFMDIVSFTPWCGSLPAGTVMKTLNLLFKEFDSLTNRHLTMTKIKCIGDCYMGAGGIFAEINQPAVHAKDVVEFGLDSIEAILKIDKEINENLRIRVGVNTGGPIVAGVLGTEKPTFEILGPTINMAQQMEHHGVPMKVHISRAVYELIYGGSFKVQERGQVELKNGNAITYLVEKKE